MIANFRNLLFFYLFIFCPILSFGQADLVTAINSELIPLKSVEATSDFSDLEGLKSILKDKRIVGLGEATHGTHEFFTFKHRMLEFLVKEMGFKTFTIEADFAGTFAMNDYVVNRNGTVLEALEEMATGVWFTKEFMDMVEWIKQYNLTQTNENKVKFYGFDMQFAFNSAPALLNGTIKLKEPLSDNARKGLQVIIDHRYGAMDKSQLPLLNATAKELEKAVVVKSSPEKTKIYQQYISAVIQTIEFSIPKHRFDKDIIRDKYMAENCEWIYNFTGESKMIVWAHNLHIAKDITKNNNLPMGYYLSQKYPNEYYAIGFGFNSGSFRAYHTEKKKIMICTVPEVSIKNSSDYVFGQCAVPNFILDFKSAQVNPTINEFLNKNIYSRAIGAQYNPKKDENGGKVSNQKLIKMYDAIIFIDNTTAVSPIRPVRNAQ